jgi:ankyrin repeat protein
MFPNPQDALPLPARPHQEQYKKQAKELVKACKSADPGAIGAWAAKWVETVVKAAALTITPRLPVRAERWAEQVEEFARDTLSMSGGRGANCSLARAQFVIAQSHGFPSWSPFAKHIEALARAHTPAAKFEAAADAIVSGDVETLRRLLRENPELIRARSAREHRATLLHYVSANGVEGYRQRTPGNAVKIAEILLEAGAEVDAEADVYGGGATTLDLVATSVHPEEAGVQKALMETLLDHGATIDQGDQGNRAAGDRPAGEGNRRGIVGACLANGRGQAAEFFAQRGVRMDLDEAAGVGRLDVLESYFHKDGSLKANATATQMERGFLWACEYGRNGVVEFLLKKGVDLLSQADTGQTGLHWAVIGGHCDTIQLLLERGASLEAKNVYGGTPMGQALWSVMNGDTGIDYVPVIEMLIDAGAKIEAGSLEWLAKQSGPSLVKARIAQLLQRRGAKS